MKQNFEQEQTEGTERTERTEREISVSSVCFCSNHASVGRRWLFFSFFAGAVSLHGAEVRPWLRDFIGLNGHTVQFKPGLYQPVGRRVRDYHPVEWDLGKKTAEPAPFPFAKNRVDWSKVYGSWREKGWDIDACLMFESIPRTNWTDIEADARAYGRALAREFGPSGTRRLVDAVEIGNEPGQWSDDDYARLFRAMAEGVREGDPQLKIAPCNLTAGKSGRYEKSVACIAPFPQLFDALNIHSYAQLENWPTWRRSFPEDPRLAKYLPDIEALIRWRDANAPSKPIWLTEFGYDSSTQPAPSTGDAARWVGVTDAQQAQWLVRSLLVFSAMPIERAYIYFFDDKDKPGLHASSGLTRNFQPKPSFHAVAHLQRGLGEYRFERMVTNQPATLRVQEYRHGRDPKKLAWAVWSPTGEGKSANRVLAGAPGKLLKAERMPLGTAPAPAPGVKERDGQLMAEVDESPLYLFFESP